MKKKNLISTYALLALFIGGVQAQTSIILSPEIGIHSSKLKPTGDLDLSDNYQGMDINYSGIFSYQGGIGVGIQFFGNWGLITGVKYNRKGGKVTVETRNPINPFQINTDPENPTFDLGEFTTTIQYNCLSIPILARGQFGGAFKVGLAIGPQINMGIGKYKETIEYNLENTSLSTDETTHESGKSSTNMFKKSHMSLLVLPYVAYDLSDNGSFKLSMMIEAGGNMVNDNLVVVDNYNNLRNVNGTMRNTQMGIMLSYEHRFDLKAGVKY